MAGVSTKEVAYLTKLQQARGRSCWSLYTLLGICEVVSVGSVVSVASRFVLAADRTAWLTNAASQARLVGFTGGWLSGPYMMLTMFGLLSIRMRRKRDVANALMIRFAKDLSILPEDVDAGQSKHRSTLLDDEHKALRKACGSIRSSKWHCLIAGVSAAFMVALVTYINVMGLRIMDSIAERASDVPARIRVNYDAGWVNGATVGVWAGLALMVGAIGGVAIANRRGKRLGLLLQYAERLGYIRPSAVPI